MVVIVLFGVVGGYALERTPTGFYYPTGTGDHTKIMLYARFLTQNCVPTDPDYGKYWNGYYHLGQDIKAKANDPVYAIANGVVKRISKDQAWGPGNVGILITHTLQDGTQFLALYGHIRSQLKEGQAVTAGDPIGVVGHYPRDGDHLHFGIHYGTNVPLTMWGDVPCKDHWTPTEEHPENPFKNGFTEPISYIETQYPDLPSASPSSVTTRGPSIKGIDPSVTPPGPFTLTITGSNFADGAVAFIYWAYDNHLVGPDPHATSPVIRQDSNQIIETINLTGAQMGLYWVRVVNPDGGILNPNGKNKSNVIPLLLSRDNPTTPPTISFPSVGVGQPTLSITPSSLMQRSGQAFHFTGRGFTGSLAIEHIKNGAGTELHLSNPNIPVQAGGTVAWDFTPNCGALPDTYDIWLTDSTNGESQHVTETITANPICGGPSGPVIPPTPIPPSGSPVAHLTISSPQGSINENQTLNLTLPMGQQAVHAMLDASRSEPSGQPLNYQWFVGGQLVGTSAVIGFDFGPGTHSIFLRVVNANNAKGETGATVSVSAPRVPPPPPSGGTPSRRVDSISNDIMVFSRTTDSSVPAGGTFTVTTTLTAKVALQIVGVVDTLPGGFTLVSGSLNSGLPTPLGASQSKTISYIVRAGSSSGTISGSARASVTTSQPSQGLTLNSLVNVVSGQGLSTLTFRPIGAHATRFTLAVTGQAIASTQLQVFNLQGQPVYDSGLQRGTHLSWNALDTSGHPLANGVYFYVVTVRGYDGKVIRSEVRKVGVMR